MQDQHSSRVTGKREVTVEIRPLHVLTPKPGKARSMSAMVMFQQLGNPEAGLDEVSQRRFQLSRKDFVVIPNLRQQR